MNIGNYLPLIIIVGCLYYLLYNPKPTPISSVQIIENTLYLPSFIKSISLFRQQSDINNTELAWDIHEVLVEKDYRAIIQTLWQYKIILLQFLGHLIYETLALPFTWKLGNTHNLLRTVLRLKKNHATGEAYEHALRMYQGALADMLVLCINNQKPRCGIRHLIQEIHAGGYVQRIASNIGVTHYPLLEQQFPEFFSYFQAGSVTQFDTHNGIKKPDPRFFWKHIQTYATKRPHFFIFLDNDQKNVLAAAQSGMIGILVQHIDQVKKDLQYLGIIRPHI